VQQADSTLPIERRRNYKSVVDALVRCAHSRPTGLRTSVVAAITLSCSNTTLTEISNGGILLHAEHKGTS
jgi:hypothetical protein